MPIDPDPSRPGPAPENADDVREALLALRAKLESVRDTLDLLEERAEGDRDRRP